MKKHLILSVVCCDSLVFRFSATSHLLKIICINTIINHFADCTCLSVLFLYQDVAFSVKLLKLVIDKILGKFEKRKSKTFAVWFCF